jgi:hypothetical protein
MNFGRSGKEIPAICYRSGAHHRVKEAKSSSSGHATPHRYQAGGDILRHIAGCQLQQFISTSHMQRCDFSRCYFFSLYSDVEEVSFFL